MFLLKNFYKDVDLVKLPALGLTIIFTLVFSFAGLLPFFISPIYSLGWQDEEWLKAGCPKNVSGN